MKKILFMGLCLTTLALWCAGELIEMETTRKKPTTIISFKKKSGETMTIVSKTTMSYKDIAMDFSAYTGTTTITHATKYGTFSRTETITLHEKQAEKIFIGLQNAFNAQR